MESGGKYHHYYDTILICFLVVYAICVTSVYSRDMQENEAILNLRSK